MPGDPNFTSGAIIAYNGNSERGWNDPPTLSFNTRSSNTNRRGKLDLRKRVAHDHALSAPGQAAQQPGFPVNAVNNDLSKGLSNLHVTDPRTNHPVQSPAFTAFNQLPAVPPPPFYNPIHQDAFTTTTASLPSGPIPTALTQPTHPHHASSMSTLPQVHLYDPGMQLAGNLALPHGFHRSVSEPNFAHPLHGTSEMSSAEPPTSHPEIRSTADLTPDSDQTASHIGQPLVKTYNPLMITPLVPIPTRQATPPLAKPVTTQPAIVPDSKTPFNSPQLIAPSVADQVHDQGRRSSSPGIQPHLLNGTTSRSETTSPAHPLPHGTPPLSRSEGSSPRSTSPKPNKVTVADDGKTSEERKNCTMEVLVQVLEAHRDSLKKAADDISKKLEVMSQRWSNGKLSETTQRKLYKLALALQQHNHSEADKIHLSIIVDHVSEVTQFMVAIKKLVVVSKSVHNGVVL